MLLEQFLRQEQKNEKNMLNTGKLLEKDERELEKGKA